MGIPEDLFSLLVSLWRQTRLSNNLTCPYYHVDCFSLKASDGRIRILQKIILLIRFFAIMVLPVSKK